MKIENNFDYLRAINFHKHLCLKPEYDGSRRPSEEVKCLRRVIFDALKEYEKLDVQEEGLCNIKN